ncbi:MAG: hypothetical protein JWM07_446 [Candidatus Saccharibacteria bacterium]|nr:hypothetical protein [Candidatus Saccharibacteria bacterium]
MSETIVPFPKKAKLDAVEIVTSYSDDQEYRENLGKRYNIGRSLARAALVRTGMNRDMVMEDNYEPDLSDATSEKSLDAMVGALPSFVHGLEGIREYHANGNISSKEYRSLKGRAARLNHAIKSLIKQNPTLTSQNITDTATTLYGVMNRERWDDNRNGYEKEAKWFSTQFEGSLRGMQHEVIADQVIQAINSVDPLIDPTTGEKSPRVTIDTNVSVDDDLHGTDMYITLDGVTFPIDIKASDRTAMNARKKSRHPQSIITTGFTAFELNGAFQVSAERANKAAPSMLQKLYAAREEYMQQNNISSDNTTDTYSHALAA